LRKKGWADSDKDGVLDKVIDGKKTPFRFTLFYANKDNEKYWILFQSDLKRAGIQLELQQLEWNALIKKVDEKDFDTIAMGWGGGAVDLDPKQIWHSSSSAKGGSNYISYNNPEVDRAIDKARGELDKKKRIPLLQDVYRKIAADVPYIFLFNDKFGFYGHTARIQMEKPARTYAIGTSYWSIKAEK
jgi:peptide/nickel transport system substrate-binding protein/microcin C transport system substrate-binding protein